MQPRVRGKCHGDVFSRQRTGWCWRKEGVWGWFRRGVQDCEARGGTEKQQPTLTGDQHPGACLLPKTALCHRLILTDTAPVVAIPAVAWRVPALPRGCPQGIPGVLSRVYPGGIPELSRLYPGMSRHCADHASMAPPGAAAGRGGLAGRLSRVI